MWGCRVMGVLGEVCIAGILRWRFGMQVIMSIKRELRTIAAEGGCLIFLRSSICGYDI